MHAFMYGWCVFRISSHERMDDLLIPCTVLSVIHSSFYSGTVLGDA